MLNSAPYILFLLSDPIAVTRRLPLISLKLEVNVPNVPRKRIPYRFFPANGLTNEYDKFFTSAEHGNESFSRGSAIIKTEGYLRNFNKRWNQRCFACPEFPSVEFSVSCDEPCLATVQWDVIKMCLPWKKDVRSFTRYRQRNSRRYVSFYVQ